MTELCYSFTKQLKSKIKNFTPEIALILGSGLGSIANQIEDPTIIKYSSIKGFPQSTVCGHQGQFVFGSINGKKVLCMQGRLHHYEGHSLQTIAQIIKTFKLLGITKLIITNAAGSLDKNMPAGSIMLISDHINLSFSNPLIGPNDENFGPRFPDISNAYNKQFQEIATTEAQKLNIKLFNGTYLMVSGPNFETAAEIKAFQILGAKAVGMSTVPEVITAAHCGIPVLGFSVITNLGTGLQEQAQSHDETLHMANQASQNLSALINRLIERI